MEISKQLIQTEIELLLKGTNDLEYTVNEIVEYIKYRDEALKLSEVIRQRELLDGLLYHLEVNSYTETFGNRLNIVDEYLKTV